MINTSPVALVILTADVVRLEVGRWAMIADVKYAYLSDFFCSNAPKFSQPQKWSGSHFGHLKPKMRVFLPMSFGCHNW